MRSLFVLTFLLTLLATSGLGQECNTPLLRDVISVDSRKSTLLRQDIGDDSSFITGIPLINSSDPLTIRTIGNSFTAPYFTMVPRDLFSPHLWITAVEIQQGPAGSYCTSSAVITNIAFEANEYTGYSPIRTSFTVGTRSADSLPYYNLQRLGGTNGDGSILRFNFGPIAADGIRMEVLSIDPRDSTVSTESCLRVEVYGCDKTGRTAPPVYPTPLLQYNLPEPSADAYSNLYTDPSYSGILSGGFASGGTGILTDGTVGGDAENSPAEWVGWNKTETPQVEMLFLLKRSSHLKRINLLYWRDSGSRIGAPVSVSILDQFDVTHSFTQTDICDEGEGVKWLSFIKETTVLTSYVKIQLQYGADVDVMLLTEIELVGEDGVSIVSDQNASVTVCPTTTTPPATTTPLLTTTTTTTTTSTTSSPSPVTTTTTTTPETGTTTQTTTTATTTATTTIDTSTPTPPVLTILEVTTSVSTTTPPDTNATSPPPEESIDQLIIGLIFVIIVIILIVVLVILLVSVFYYMKSKGKGVGNLNFVGTRSKFQKLMSADVEANRPGLKKRLQSMSFLKGRSVDPVYEPVQPKPLILEPVPLNEETSKDPFSDGDSFTDQVDDLNIYAPVSALSSIYATVNKKKRDTIYEEPQLNLSLYSTPLDSVQTDGQALRPLSSIYEAPALLAKEEEPLVLTPRDVEEVELLGNGQFGEVWLAILTDYSARELGLGASQKRGVEVALKKLPGVSDKKSKDNFSNEVKFMARLDHPNVIKMIGVCLDVTAGRFIAMEYMINGDLALFLKESDYVATLGANLRFMEVNKDCMVYMGQQIASGMEYLSDRNYVHRDLSTRNCLVGSNYSVKVTDFGMSQNLYSSEYFKITGRATLPIRWMANESFYGKFTIKSDVWAFGVTLWEIFTKCEEKPYRRITDHELIQDVLSNKENRLKLERADYASEEIWEIIIRCMYMDQDKRPNFDEIRRELEDMCSFQIEEITI